MAQLYHNSSRQIKLGAIISYVAMAFNIIAGLIYTPWMVNQIGQADYGLYALAISLISFFAMDFGLGSAVARFLSKYMAEDENENAKRFLGSINKLFLVLSGIICIVFILLYFSIENIYIELTNIEIEKLKILFLISGMFSVISFPFKPLDGILIANERFILIKLMELVHRVLTVMLMVTALLMGYGLYALVVVNALVGFIKILIKFYYIKIAIKTEVDYRNSEKGIYREIFKFSVWTTVIIIAQRFIMNITPTILGAIAGSTQIALFSIGMTIEAYIFSVSGALGGLFLPKVTRMLIKSEDRSDLEKLLIKVGRIQLLIVGLIVIGFASMGKEFILLWMGENFSDSYYIALILILPALVYNTQEIANTALIALNEIKYRSMATIVTAATSVVLSIILSQKYGAIGSAGAIFFGNIIGTVILMNIIYYRVLKIDIVNFFKECHIKFIIPLILTYSSGLLIQFLIPVNSMALFVIKVFVIGIIYFLLMWKITLNTFEKQLILSFFRRIGKRR